jgi:hypothetical protein
MMLRDKETFLPGLMKRFSGWPSPCVAFFSHQTLEESLPPLDEPSQYDKVRLPCCRSLMSYKDNEGVRARKSTSRRRMHVVDGAVGAGRGRGSPGDRDGRSSQG